MLTRMLEMWTVACKGQGTLEWHPLDPSMISAANFRDAWGFDDDQVWFAGQLGTIMSYRKGRESPLQRVTIDGAIDADTIWAPARTISSSPALPVC